MFTAYHDIFVRNAFGNYKDVLREVSYSAMMAEMLTFYRYALSDYQILNETLFLTSFNEPTICVHSSQ